MELAQMAEAEKDAAMLAEAEMALGKVAEALHTLEIESLLSGEADANDCFLEINSGAGGTESQDWASMLLRMYVRWAGKRGFKTECVDAARKFNAGFLRDILGLGFVAAPFECHFVHCLIMHVHQRLERRGVTTLRSTYQLLFFSLVHRQPL